MKSQLIEPAVAGLAPVHLPQESAPEFYAWSALLRSLSAFEAYHEVYRDALEGRRVTELLILRPDVPRSLRACCDEIRTILPDIEALPGSLDAGREVKLLAGKLALKLEYGVVDDILDAGVHRWLTDFLAQSARLGDAIGKAYLEAN